MGVCSLFASFITERSLVFKFLGLFGLKSEICGVYFGFVVLSYDFLGFFLALTVCFEALQLSVKARIARKP